MSAFHCLNLRRSYPQRGHTQSENHQYDRLPCPRLSPLVDNMVAEWSEEGEVEWSEEAELEWLEEAGTVEVGW